MLNLSERCTRARRSNMTRKYTHYKSQTEEHKHYKRAELTARVQITPEFDLLQKWTMPDNMQVNNTFIRTKLNPDKIILSQDTLNNIRFTAFVYKNNLNYVCVTWQDIKTGKELFFSLNKDEARRETLLQRNLSYFLSLSKPKKLNFIMNKRKSVVVQRTTIYNNIEK